ncbi:inactive serine/threonine-protein kinase PLK5 isoform X2 [Dromiciops gliroides]|uniref:inactive serine/threonine-protein kinase PLK5 isoform X2 n=1 Tax=Dromiciops gliroides TaxID=33562 RepID=UPI001CC4EEBF|nr:inactive serine/threonine-protein kinase PLK5 isoform X2 [Dromiciops gliroides]
MELRGPRRRGPQEPVASFLRDPSTGRIYRRGRLLGTGAFGRCYKLTDMSTNRVFALKVLPRGRLCGLDQWGKRGPPSRRQVEREIELHSQLRHRNVVGFHGHFADQDNVYLVLEHCSRKSLAHVLKARKTLTEPEVRYYLRGIAAGLRYLHQQGIIHRDLKLSNFFITKNMEVKIGDLGLATKVGAGGHCHGGLCGTPNYLAPEVVSRKGHSFQSDIWALGCIMYTALTGFPPFKASPVPEMYQSIRDACYPVPAHLSPNARRLIARLLAPNPADRPSLDQVLEDDFFTQGFTPDRLPPRSCHTAPIFTIPQPLDKLFQKATQLFLAVAQRRAPRSFIPKVPTAPVPEDPQKTPKEAGSEVLSHPPHKAEAPEEETQPQVPYLETPIHLLLRRSLRCHSPGTEESPGIPGDGAEVATRLLQSCLGFMPTGERDPPGWQQPVLWATKWVDYSNKYGFGYELSDRSTGVLLRDGTHIALQPALGCISYSPVQGEVVTFTWREIPDSLATKVAVLQLFTRYMQRWLVEGGSLPTQPSLNPGPGFSLLHFLKSDRALLLLFSDQTMQVNFYHDHTKLLLNWAGEEALLTYIDQERRATSRPLGILQRQGCSEVLRQRLCYTLQLLQTF